MPLQLDTPLFVLGSPRSGTSLLRLTLTSHPQVIIPPECGFILWLADAYGGWNASACDDAALLERFLADLSGARKFTTWNLPIDRVGDEIKDARPRNYAELCAVVVQAYCRQLGKTASVWGDKNNYYVRHVGDLFKLYPEGRFLHIVRDVRDIACSYREVMDRNFSSEFRPDLPTDIDAIADTWMADVEHLSSAFNEIPDRQKLTIRYEDLVADAEAVLANVCRWLGIPYDAGMRDFHLQNRSRQLEPQETMGWKEKTLLPMDQGSVNRYRRLLPKAEADQMARRAASWLEAFGYLA